MTETWPEVPIGEVMAEFHDGPHATPKPSEVGPVYLGIKNITDEGHLDLSAIRHIAEEDFPTWVRRVQPQAGDIVFSYEATLHRYAVIPSGFRGCLGRRLALIRPDSSKVDTRFLHYYFLSPGWKRTVLSRTNIGSTVDRIPLVDFPGFPIVLPPLGTQRRIAAVLSAFDDLIANNTRRIAILEDMARTIYREWFVEFRYPGYEGVPLVESELGPIPEGWRIGTLNDVAEFVGGSPLTKASYVADGFRAYSAAGPDGLLEDFAVDGRGVVLSAVGARCGRTWYASGRWSNIANTIRYLPRSDISAEWLFLATEGIESWPRRGAAQPFVSINDARGRPVTIPPRGVLARFAEVSVTLYDLASALDCAIDTSRLMRDLLLPRFVSGEIDVSDLDLDVGVVV